MKKVFIVLLLFISVKFIYADQLAWITKDQAEQTVQYFKDNDIEQVVLWCACCDNDRKLLVEISRIYYKPVEGQQYYEIFIEGTLKTGGGYKQAVDLAYVHIKKGSKWKCVGTVMGFECDPCTKPFKM